MNIQLLSDLHLEFDLDWGENFIDSLNPEGIDVLILAGDIINYPRLNPVISWICKKYENRSVLYVPGNHEHYTGSPELVIKQLANLLSSNSNLRILANNIIHIGNQRFIGATMWFPKSEQAILQKHTLNDFSFILDFEPWVYEQNKLDTDFLAQNIESEDIVVTHHAPSIVSASREYRASPINCFYVNDMTRVIKDKQPRYWLHGHMHSSSSYRIARTSIICNPRGYHGSNPLFNKRLILGISENNADVKRPTRGR
jgi:Icc-related predicted phosphoesterase